MTAADKNNRYSCDHVVPIEQEPRHHLVFENEFVRAFAVEIGPHVRTLCHHHPNDYLLYVAGGAEIVSAARDEEPKQLSYSDGECELLSAGLVHVVDNLGETTFRNVVVELLPSADGLRRGEGPKAVEGGVHISRIFDDERAAIFAVELEPGGVVSVHGPATMATPYGHRLNPEEAGVITVKRHVISDLAWIPNGEQAVLWGCEGVAETAIIFQLGRVEEDLAAVPIIRRPVQSLNDHADESK